MALLSRWPIDSDALADFLGSAVARLARSHSADNGRQALPIHRGTGNSAFFHRSAIGPFRLPRRTAQIWVAAFHATPPVFDGVEDRNGLRNRDEAALWLRWLDGALKTKAPEGPLVIMGDANLDPADGDGRPDALNALLDHNRLRDPISKIGRRTCCCKASGWRQFRPHRRSGARYSRLVRCLGHRAQTPPATFGSTTCCHPAI